LLLQEINGQMDCSAEVPINSSAMTINSPMFEGTMEVHLKGLPSSQPRIFEGKKRFFQIMVQVSSMCVGVVCLCASLLRLLVQTGRHCQGLKPMQCQHQQLQLRYCCSAAVQ
jgi:hypothetical protein